MDLWQEIKVVWREKRKWVIGGGILLIMMIVGALWWFRQQPTESLANSSSGGVDCQTISYSQRSSHSQTKKYYVDIKGAIKKPGVYAVVKGSRITKLLKQAGGASEEADLSQVNLAQKLNDEDVIYIPYKGENIHDFKQQSAQATTQKSQNTSSAGKVNLNTADKNELMSLNGIGAKKADQIIAYRTKNGSFQNVTDLKNVSGIGDKIYASLAEQITV
ncbi:helix-hairpin-helix domain-containing protein [Ligilactobacillus ceti]|uniref:DNA uptake protein n=1 Tax=Ligilactobacillus ceti DSM 22408 TaxID=1122146 RepID=A0A0R2KQU9_9LACO|nr:helix-hairpin-helix domain-containing protein [Ligilactobacillus ceti]KRN88922.1 DNA uptake protein [Ligilactobacillus ceti DSM 22408]